MIAKAIRVSHLDSLLVHPPILCARCLVLCLASISAGVLGGARSSIINLRPDPRAFFVPKKLHSAITVFGSRGLVVGPLTLLVVFAVGLPLPPSTHTTHVQKGRQLPALSMREAH